jgi:drug/metabolite transporter (DMT)-like permease
MITLPWYLTALAAAVVWGIHYPLVDHALKKLSLPGVLLLTALPILLLSLLTLRHLQNDIGVLQAASWPERLLLLAPALTSLAGSVLLFAAIGSKNATLASLIEISYPAFVVLFAWLLFKEMHLNTSALLGSALVMSGVVLIASSNP